VACVFGYPRAFWRRGRCGAPPPESVFSRQRRTGGGSSRPAADQAAGAQGFALLSEGRQSRPYRDLARGVHGKETFADPQECAADGSDHFGGSAAADQRHQPVQHAQDPERRPQCQQESGEHDFAGQRERAAEADRSQSA